MGKERPENTICGLERQGAGYWHAAARRRRARRGARAVRDIAARRRPARNCVSVPCFERVKLQKNCIEVLKVMNRKVVDLTTLYNFHKGRIVFFSTDFAQTAAKLRMSQHSGEQEVLSVDHVFHQFPLKI
jgi:hypothetical protein